MYKLTLDNLNYINSYAVVFDEICKNNEVVVENIPNISTIEELQSYQYVDGEFVFDGEKYIKLTTLATTYVALSNVQNQIKELEQELSASDYKIIKSYEQSLVGLECEYDIAALHAERQAIRDKINQLQVQEASLL